MAILNTVAQFGRYVLRNRICEAGACDVWMAEVDGSAPGAPPVIFKKLKSEHRSNAVLAETFTLRATTALQLKHECIARVLDVVSDRNDCGLAMEFVDGKTLRQLVSAVGGAGNALPVWFAIHVARCICQAIEHAHGGTGESGQRAPVFHENLVPENVFLTFFGQVKVTDFGLSRAALLRANSSASHATLRTPISVSSVGAKQVSPLARDDLDGIGRILYELLTGIRPEVTEHPDSKLLPPSHYAPWVNVEVDQLLSRILSSTDPQRFQSAGDMRRALDDYLSTRRHDVTATHVAGLIDVLFSPECRSSAPPTARLQANAVELAILRSRRTSPPDLTAKANRIQDEPPQTKRPSAADGPLARPLAPLPPSIAPKPEKRSDVTTQPPSAPTRAPEAQRLSDGRSSSVDDADNHAGPFHHDWDLALKRAKEEAQATQRASGNYPTANAQAKPEPPMDPVERAILEFERGLEHMSRGEFEAAMKAWERALEFDPQHRVCRANLNLLKKKLGARP